jgi:hypothetical protein
MLLLFEYEKRVIIFLMVIVLFLFIANGHAQSQYSEKSQPILSMEPPISTYGDDYYKKEEERDKILYKQKDLGLIQFEDHCIKESLEKDILREFMGHEKDCKIQYYLRIRLVCLQNSSPNLIDVPFPRRNVTVVVEDKSKKERLLTLTGMPEDGYLQGLLKNRKELSYNGNLTVSISFHDFQKVYSIQEVYTPIQIPIQNCLKKK